MFHLRNMVLWSWITYIYIYIFQHQRKGVYQYLFILIRLCRKSPNRAWPKPTPNSPNMNMSDPKLGWEALPDDTWQPISIMKHIKGVIYPLRSYISCLCVIEAWIGLRLGPWAGGFMLRLGLKAPAPNF